MKFLPFCKEQVTNNPKACKCGYIPHHLERLRRIHCVCTLPASYLSLCPQQSCEIALFSCEIIPARSPEWKIQKLNSCPPSHSSVLWPPMSEYHCFLYKIKLISACIKAHVVMERLFHGLIVQALQQLRHSLWGGSTQGENVRCSLAACNAV